MACKTSPADAQAFYERVCGRRPLEPRADSENPEAWAEISQWDWKRAEFFSYMMIYDDCDKAYAMIKWYS